MPESWQTVEQAAVALGMSVRTVNRHLAAGKIASRLTDGRREVLVNLPDQPAEPAVAPEAIRLAVREAFARLNAASEELQKSESPATQEIDPVGQPQPIASKPQELQVTSEVRHQDLDTLLALADSASDKAQLAVAAYQTLARLAESRGQASARQARLAWAAVMLMAVGTTAAVGWTAHHLTRSRVEATQLREQVTALRSETDRNEQERAAMRLELSAAREEAARVEGKLESTEEEKEKLRAQIAQRQKQSKTLLDRWSSLWND